MRAIIQILISLTVLLGASTAIADETPRSPSDKSRSTVETEVTDDSSRYLIDTGPLRIRDQFLLGLGFLAFDPVAADIVLGAKLGLLPESKSGSFELAAEALLKLPTGDPEKFTGSGSTDVGVQVLATRYSGKSCLHGSIGLAYLGAYERLAISSQLQLSGMFAYERACGRKTSILAQATISQSPFSELDLEELAALSTQITLGVKRVIGKQVLFVGFTENVANFDNSPDVGFHIGLTRIRTSRQAIMPRRTLRESSPHDVELLDRVAAGRGAGPGRAPSAPWHHARCPGAQDDEEQRGRRRSGAGCPGAGLAAGRTIRPKVAPRCPPGSE